MKIQRLDLVGSQHNCSKTSDSFQGRLLFKRRRRVRFDSPCSNAAESISVHVIDNLVPASEMADNEKAAIWYPSTSVRENMAHAEFQATKFAFRRIVDSHARKYSESLTGIYASCAVDDMYHEDISTRLAQNLALSEVEYALRVAGDSTRGLEKVTSPEMGQDIIRRRKEAIDTVLFAQFALRCGHTSSEEHDELLRTICEEQTKCLRRYAKAMGTADAISAVFEYRGFHIIKNRELTTSSESNIDKVQLH
jgi:hypothetical protein